MTKFVGVMPFVYLPYVNDCIDTIDHTFGENILMVDNSKKNLGVSASWNMGIDRMVETDADWLIILSAAIRFGEPGGTDVIEQLEKHAYADVIHFATKDVGEQLYIRGEHIEGNLGWHLTAINKRVINRVGRFDEKFYPGYFEDIDYDLRIRKAFDDPTWLVLPVDATCESISHGVELGKVKIPVNELIAYFATKWGRHPNATQLGEYERPFNE